jgi:Ca2+-binding EF-hand superfamily protein
MHEYFHSLSFDSKLTISQFFKTFDDDNDGTLDEKEFEKFMKSISMRLEVLSLYKLYEYVK